MSPIDPADPRAVLRALFEATVAAARPELCVPAALPEARDGRLIVVGAGKAAAAMARAVEGAWTGPIGGAVVTRRGQALPCRHVEILEASHPVPDEASVAAARRMLALAEGAGPDDTVLCLISGGGSSLMVLPGEGLTLDDKRAVNRALLASGAGIGDMNCVRRHLSGIKGGRLAAAAHPARVITLAISDVPGDRFLDIASGPTVADPTTCRDALDVVERWAVDLPPAARALLESGRGESVKPGDPRLARAEARLIATPRLALAAASDRARALGLTPLMLGDRIEGEARDVARALAGIALAAADHGEPVKAPAVILSGGETTVTLRGTGRGGRNVEFQLALALALQGRTGIYALAADTDGVDGVEEVAGAYLDPTTLTRAHALGLDPAAFLARNDAHAFFEALDDRLITGPTSTNVNDFRAMLLLPEER